MAQELQVLRCYKCETFQVDIVKKTKKWTCKICGEKQSVKKVYGRGAGKDCRARAQELNKLRCSSDCALVEMVERVPVGSANLNDEEIFSGPTNKILKLSSSSDQPGHSRWSEFVDQSQDINEYNSSSQNKKRANESNNKSPLRKKMRPGTSPKLNQINISGRESSDDDVEIIQEVFNFPKQKKSLGNKHNRQSVDSKPASKVGRHNQETKKATKRVVQSSLDDEALSLSLLCKTSKKSKQDNEPTTQQPTAKFSKWAKFTENASTADKTSINSDMANQKKRKRQINANPVQLKKPRCASPQSTKHNVTIIKPLEIRSPSPKPNLKPARTCRPGTYVINHRKDKTQSSSTAVHAETSNELTPNEKSYKLNHEECITDRDPMIDGCHANMFKLKSSFDHLKMNFNKCAGNRSFYTESDSYSEQSITSPSADIDFSEDQFEEFEIDTLESQGDNLNIHHNDIARKELFNTVKNADELDSILKL